MGEEGGREGEVGRKGGKHESGDCGRRGWGGGGGCPESGGGRWVKREVGRERWVGREVSTRVGTVGGGGGGGGGCPESGGGRWVKREVGRERWVGKSVGKGEPRKEAGCKSGSYLALAGR